MSEAVNVQRVLVAGEVVLSSVLCVPAGSGRQGYLGRKTQPGGMRECCTADSKEDILHPKPPCLFAQTRLCLCCPLQVVEMNQTTLGSSGCPTQIAT